MKRCLPSNLPDGSGPEPVAQLVGHLFRREYGRLVGILARRFGPEHLHLAEHVVQDALVKAMETWPFTGVPGNPSAWILHTARNRALDQARRSKIWRGKQPLLLPLVEDCLHSARRTDTPRFEDEIQDSQLRMMFVCCHPELPPEGQVALILKVLCGFGEREIAAAFLTTEQAIAKRLGRARRFLRENQVSTDLPHAQELTPWLGSVHQALYLLFSEGHKASQGPSLLRDELCADAIRLAELLTSRPFAGHPETHALLALMNFITARRPARVGAEGAILTLADQDRAHWDQARIRQGVVHLAQSAAGAAVSRYHLEAGIAACHSLARSEVQTDWGQILEYYDALQAMDASPIVALNRAVAVAKVRGAEAGLRAVEAISRRGALQKYHLLHAVTGHLLLEAGNFTRAAASFRRAWELAPIEAERDLLAGRIAAAERGSRNGSR